MKITATRLNICHLFFTAMALLAFAGQAPADANAPEEDITTNVIALNKDNVNPLPDFDGDGTVGLPDFLLFVDQFGFSRDDEGYESRFDLDGDGTIGISDFLIFVNNFGKKVPPSSGGVTIPDANLRAAIEDALGKASGAPITQADMKTLTSLEAQFAGISDLTGLEFATNLTRLDLWENNITNISVLAGLTNLTELYLWENNITNISALAGLTNLITLNLRENNISDISVLAGLTNLTSLSLSNNNISDISVLAGLTNLTSLSLRENNISDISVLAGLTNLITLYLSNNNISDISVLAELTNLTWLDLPENNITDISVLAGLTNLTELRLWENNITDISALAELTNLTWLDLWENNITDISALAELTNLTWLDLWENNITDISALAELTNLTWLDLWENNIMDISALAGLTNLTSLSLGNNIIMDISALAGLTNLTSLSLGNNIIMDISALAGLTNLPKLWLNNNNISDISALAGLTNLTFLNLSENNITDISVLAGLTNLTELGLVNTNITDISALAGLTNLTELWLQENNITDISVLAGLTNLTSLRLSNNNISNISALAGLNNLAGLDLNFNTITDISVLAGLTNLTELWLKGNPLTVSSVNDHIPALKSNGIRVFFDSFRVAGDFDIELVFSDHFTESQKNVLRYVARRWMAVITEDLPDYEFTQGWSGTCGDQSYEIPAGERIDDLRIYISTFEGGSAVGWGSQRLLREETHLPVLGCMAFDLKRANLWITGLHEIGHVLGFGSSTWNRLGLTQDFSHDDPNADTHFNGPLAIAAFNDAGGRNYAGAKVPLEKMDGAHWRYSVLPGELMVPGGGGALSAITVQSLADLGYGVDVTQADPYTLPGATAGKVSAKIATVMPSIPSYGADVTQPDAYTMPVVGPHWQGKVSRAVSSIPEDDRLRMRLAPPPIRANPNLKCGVGLINEPIYVIDKQGNIVRTISH